MSICTIRLKPTEFEADEYQRQGQELYRQGKYHAALQRFNAVVQEGRKPSLNLLDSRAATHAKLGDLRAGLRDGRTMIQEYKINCTGYLRTGQILRLLGKQDAALNIYQYGLRNVPSKDPNRELIQLMYDKLVKQCCPHKSVDPLQVLPAEVNSMVFEYLDFMTIVKLSTVSRSWRSFLHSTPKLWSGLNLSGAKKSPPIGTVLWYIKRSRGSVVNAKLLGNKPDLRILKCIATRCKALARLEISGGLTCMSLVDAAPALTRLQTLHVGGEISLDAVCQILSHCSSLETAKFRSVFARYPAYWTGDLSRLRSLSITSREHIRGNSSSDTLELTSLVPKLGRIRELDIKDNNNPDVFTTGMLNFSSLTELEILGLANMHFAWFPRLPQSIQTLNINGCHNCSSDDIINYAKLDNLSRLVMGNFEPWQDFPIAALYALLEPNKGNLLSLDLTSCTHLSSEDMKHLTNSGYFSRLEELRIPRTWVDDHLAELLAANLSSLIILDISETKVTGIGVKALVEKPGTKLQKLYLWYCNSVGVDAVEYARSCGIWVKFAFPDALGGKKRIWNA
ncbi:MAG: hypothetical protein Q9191_005673 [Dirinaria sp. TL-2023a]